MIITKDFAYCQKIKTGSSTVSYIIKNFFPQNKILSIHGTFKEHFEEIKKLNIDKISNFRRLPEWILSTFFSIKKMQEGINFNTYYENGKIWRSLGKKKLSWSSFYQKNNNIYYINIEEYLKSIFCEDLKNYKIIRTECLNKDFLNIFSKYREFNNYQKKIILNSHIFKTDYNKNKKYFTKKQIKQIYKDCPFWADLEKQIYGNLLI